MSYRYYKCMRERTEELVVDQLVRAEPISINRLIELSQNLEDVHQAEIEIEPNGVDSRDIDERIAQSMLNAIHMAYVRIQPD